MTQVLDDRTRAKIRRRASRAFDAFDAGVTKKIHRISGPTADKCEYRLRHSPGRPLYSGPKVTVTRDQTGKVEVPDTLPKQPKIDLLTRYDLSKLDSHYGPVRAYKVTKSDGQGHYQGGITYEEKNAVTDKSRDCAAGINLASRDWAKNDHQGDRQPRSREV